MTSLQIIGQTLYIGGEFQNGAGIPSADYLLACSLATGAPTSPVSDPLHPFSGSVYALTADSNGTLYAGGAFINLEDVAAADNVAYLPSGGEWHADERGPRTVRVRVTDFVRGLTAVGTDVYIGTDADDVDGIPQADHVAKWNGSGGAPWAPAAAARTDGSRRPRRSRPWSAPARTSSSRAAFLNANGDARADNVAFFDGTAWHPVGSDGAGNGPWLGNGLALALVDRQLYAAGTFTSAGGDNQARSAASFALAQIIAYPTPTVTQGPGPVPTPTVTPAPAAPDVTAPATSLRRTRLNHAARKATFRFGSGESGSTFACKLDRKRFRACTSPKTYKKLKRGKHVFRVKARDRAGNLDPTPVVKRFKIRKR